ncbi:hypothetical protein C7974DRAFT_31998 [Boeremia exigua]|uniref:uncharacterized protein n=1 Tax=Boeremia exigua TaxID=749465 RepID=UPI001E8D0318|nr:uncharacterized protein C7974DRAFT_31998 [Boeremia exigua]KAH6618545.1 hypothetical protein C7974DRAFT_31998 [Boeremia exigua]
MALLSRPILSPLVSHLPPTVQEDASLPPASGTPAIPHPPTTLHRHDSASAPSRSHPIRPFSSPHSLTIPRYRRRWRWRPRLTHHSRCHAGALYSVLAAPWLTLTGPDKAIVRDWMSASAFRARMHASALCDARCRHIARCEMLCDTASHNALHCTALHCGVGTRRLAGSGRWVNSAAISAQPGGVAPLERR